MNAHVSVAPPFIAVVPARLASTRLPDKPLADIGGKPMVVRVAERARFRTTTIIATIRSPASTPIRS